MSSGENRIVLDWDGTLVPQEWPDHPPMTAEAVLFVEALLHEGWEVVVDSTRLAPCDVDEETMLDKEDTLREWEYIRHELDRQGFHYVKIWDKPWKPGARWYVDDKAIPFQGNWDWVLHRIELGELPEVKP